MPITEFQVEMTTLAVMKTSVTVQAKSKDEAELLASRLANNGDVSWTYDGTQDGTLEVTSVVKSSR